MSSFVSPAAGASQVHDINSIPDTAVGELTSYLQETSGPLQFDDVLAAYNRNEFVPGNSRVLSFGIGAPAVWIALSVRNSSYHNIRHELVIDNSWLDKVQVIFRHRERGIFRHYMTGDDYPFIERPELARTFHFNATFPPGVTDIFIRVQSPDPMVVPIYFTGSDTLHPALPELERSYGFVYGYLIALLAYNVMLFFGLRDLRYLLYAIYLGAFTLMNIAYSGHGFMYLWPNMVEWQRWAQPLLMTLYGATGLIFALYFLDTRKYSKRLYYLVNGVIAAAAAVVACACLLHDQAFALFTAFGFVATYIVLMMALGIAGMYVGNPSARYFMIAVAAGIVGSTLTLLSVWGVIPYNDWTFHAVEYGMLIEATLLALALGYRFRVVDDQRLLAERLASTDPLTNLDNRRSFYEKANSIWSTAVRHNRPLCLILFDLDDFKAINDHYGHLCGDLVLTELGNLLKNTIRQGDIAARWGGEEFILLLPETTLDDAAVLTERIHARVELNKILYGKELVSYTASFGVVQRTASDTSLDGLVKRADKSVYAAKARGKNQVIVTDTVS